MKQEVGMGYSFIKLSRENQVGRIILNRPEAHNAINPELLAELTQAIRELRDSSDIKAVVVTGEGEAFCSGTDLKFLQKAMTGDMGLVFEFGRNFGTMVATLDEFPVPTIAMVNGFTFAGGIELMLACDMIIAAEDAKIGDQHMNRGTIGGPVMWQLPQRIGLQKAMEVVLTGKWLSGKEAERYGIVLRAVPRGRLEEELEAILAQLRNKSLSMLKLAKKVLRQASLMPNLTEAIKYVTAEWSEHQAPQTGLRQGVAHFVEQRETRPK
jgi:enoyl-CoA hydratase/carnithine racemase